MRTVYNATERILIPEAVADLARRRCRAFLNAAVHSQNVLDALIVDCYLQGLSDGADAQQHEDEKEYLMGTA